jgi:sterol 3beta-glucosyltransferase
MRYDPSFASASARAMTDVLAECSQRSTQRDDTVRIALTSFGTRGDVQPFLVLAMALQARGHDVTLAVPPNVLEWAAQCGVRIERIGFDTQAYMDSPEGQAMFASGNVRAIMKRMQALMHAHQDLLLADQMRICDGADVIVAGVLTEDHSAVMAEAQGIPLIALHLAPLMPTGDFAHSLVTTRDLRSRLLHRLTYAVVERLWWAAHRDSVALLRSRMGLASTRRPTQQRLATTGLCSVQAFSSHLVPRPSDWGPTQRIVGSFQVPKAARRSLGEAAPAPQLAAWLEAGPPPVYVGLGSMPVREPDRMLNLLGQVARRCNCRMVVGAGWSTLASLQDPSSEIRLVGAIDHDWLLPRCSAAVHHGGAGTTHAVVRAGLPSVVASVFADQPFWGARLAQLGVGCHMPFRKVTCDSLERGLRLISKADAVAHAATLSARMRSDPNPVSAAVRLIEESRLDTICYAP